jgi:HEAT repeat protein
MLRFSPEKFTQTTKELDARTRYIIVLLICNSLKRSILDFALTFSYDANPDVRIAALQAFLHPENATVINRLKECLNDTEQSSVRKYTVSEFAAKILAASGLLESPANEKRKSSEIVKTRLINAKATKEHLFIGDTDINDTGEHEVILTENSLEKPSADDLRVANILKQMREQGWDTSNDAAKQLRDYAKQLRGKASTRIMNQIIETLNDEDWVIRWSGVETLGWIGNVYVVPHLIQRLTDSNWKIRVAAIRALAEIKDETAVEAISDLMIDTHSVVREAAAEALGNFGSEKTILALEKASSDSEEFVRLAAVESLGRIQHKLAITSLLSSLKDNSDHVRWAAANALVGISTPQITAILAQSLNDNGGPYWEQKRICDVIADILNQFNTDEAKSALALWRKNQAQSSN